MTIRHYSRVVPHVAWLIWLSSFVVALPVALLLTFIVPSATPDEIAVVIAAPLALFFLYAHLAAWLLATTPNREKGEHSSMINFMANVIMVMLFSVPSVFVYWLADIGWATQSAGLVSALCVISILVAILLRRLAGGARNIARIALLPAALVATAGSAVVHFSSAVTVFTNIPHVRQHRDI